MRSNKADFMASINDSGNFNDDIAAEMKSAIESFKTTGSW
jgi:F-type H+-transporting ATPase subunit alpha